jgi:KUP system potassium uptake protein
MNSLKALVLTQDQPYVDTGKRVEVGRLRDGFHLVTGRYGFMEEPNVPDLILQARQQGLSCDESRVTFFLSKETIIATGRGGMRPWRRKLFAFMSRNAVSAASFFKLPPNRVVELGMQVEM